MKYTELKTLLIENLKKNPKALILSVLGVQALIILTVSMTSGSSNQNDEIVPISPAIKRSFPIEVHTHGELDARNSISIASHIRQDQPKAIYIIPDGTHVNKGDLLIKIDATPYEKKVEELHMLISETESQLKAVSQGLQWEIEQAEHEKKAAFFEMETALLELSKITYGDGPLEEARLKGSMQKAKAKYEELERYSEDLLVLEAEGYLDAVEVKQTQKRLQEEKEAYENAMLQYLSFVEHVHPMQIKKAESSIKRLENKQEECERNCYFKIFKAEIAAAQAENMLLDAEKQLNDAENELSLTEIRAVSPGMVVLKEDFRGMERRKLRIGDTLVRNQAVIDLPDMSSLIVKTKVRESDLYKVEVGKPATVGIDAYPHLSLKGNVLFIGILALPDMLHPTDEKFFEVKVALNETDLRLRPGMTARVVIHAGEVDNQIAVPIHSVFEFDKKNYCYLKKRNSFVLQPVEVGMNNEQWVAINSGLTENDEVCLAMPPENTIKQ